MSSSDECLTPLMSLKRFNNPSTTPNRTHVSGSTTSINNSKRDVPSKLSLKKKENKENSSQNSLHTPTDVSKQKVSASFIFSSCKKKKVLFDETLPPGHTFLASESSDEEFVSGCIPHPNSTVVDDSLVEYSLIRKWLQNAEDPNSSEDSEQESPRETKAVVSRIAATTHLKNDLKFSPIINGSLKKEPKSQLTSIDDTIVLSSDDDCRSPLIIHGKTVFNRDEESKLAIQESSISDNSFDSSFGVTPSLKDRLLTTNKAKQPTENLLASDSDDDDSIPALKLPTRCRALISESSSEDEVKPVPKPSYVRAPTATAKPSVHPTRQTEEFDSDLESLFVSLTVNDQVPVVVKPKTTVRKPRTTKKKVIEPPAPERPISTRRQASFLESLSAQLPDNQPRHPDALPYLKSFRKLRDELTQRLFRIFNREVFQDRLPHDFSITWNNRLTRTAGYCRHFTRREGVSTKFESKIELSVKVVDTPCRVRDTLIHELCHATTWMIDNCRGGHGPVWRKWANLALQVFPELPAISRCHNYEIAFKFYYNCSVCPFSTGRHSKSVDTTTHVCPRCRGKLQLSSEPPGTPSGSTKPTGTSTASAPKTPRTPNAFALFVKEHYASTKSSRSDLAHAAVMKILSAKFAESKRLNGKL